jgi:hypothetical protein
MVDARPPPIRIDCDGRRLAAVQDNRIPANFQIHYANRELHADLSDCFDPEKVRTAKEALARGSMDPADYPTPGLAVELDILPSQVDRPSIDAALNVSEYWRIKRDRKVVIEHLPPDGSSALFEARRFLGMSADETNGWLTADDVSQEEVWYCRPNEWAMGLGRRA